MIVPIPDEDWKEAAWMPGEQVVELT